ncbi:MAG: DUF4097 family beta strand repeat protein [Candidatus Marinimicrobia bacterium]|jgi:DUF4097 and DUF4098 domain-containing protein YvlB|nr:DUF4097 family beta strand repeat protein [Candidatus Neomarinimicrobiota bacterium]MBT3501219.1 DUF4097 family beta strand repeat protein [Candidatus Neomarinimicrobiota bacterium]MBT3839500.1 DUF4097 family beta strand repeat protein [Candidatus Neomarinimicrobiota bacterium]MBT3999401.1 DUF4097 family beta strand repeat protein [Candidatus Neomarinimicrobiota bacterium]MBT4282515.1 DUF4097 family beta strand repeat protein [Candidatus Neomarinimicrobiota bacterium]
MIRFLLLFQLTSFLYGQKIFEEFEKDRNNKYHYKETYRFDTVPDDGSYTLLLENIEGDIQVSTHSGSGAEFTITRKIRSTTEKKAKQLVKSSTILVYHLQDDQLIQIKTKKKMRYKRDLETEFDLKLPMNINLNLETSGGNIAVIDIRGESILTTSGGDMKLKNMMGRIEARTSGGDIEVSGTEGLIRVHTSGGDIAIENSDGHFNSSTSGGDLYFLHLTGNIDAQTSGGSISLENIEGESINIRTSGGDIAAEDISSNLTAMTSGGEIDLDNIKGHVDVTTSDGDIDARQITGSLNCHTSGGDIDADDIIGTVNASTTNGDIEMELSYDSSIKEYSFNLDTRSGDIFIRVPTGLPVNINAEIFGTSTAQELNSDIPLTISSTENRVTGIGKIQNGTIPLHLRASLGTITIKQD